MDVKNLEGMIRKILAEMDEGRSEESTRRVDESGIISIRAEEAELTDFPFDIVPDRARVRLAHLAGPEESPRLRFGLMEIDASGFPWTVERDTLIYVIEGGLEIIIDDRVLNSEAGGLLFIPAASALEISAPAFARFLYCLLHDDRADTSN